MERGMGPSTDFGGTTSQTSFPTTAAILDYDFDTEDSPTTDILQSLNADLLEQTM